MALKIKGIVKGKEYEFAMDEYKGMPKKGGNLKENIGNTKKSFR